MSPAYSFSETLGRAFTSESAFADGMSDSKDADPGGELRLMPMDSGAIRSGVLEKATKDVALWKLRCCALHTEAFWYSKDTSSELEGRKDAQARRSKWTCIPLTTCVQLVRWTDDGRVFLIQTRSRSYYWRARSQSEAEAWLLSIGTQCAAIKELELLREAEDRTIRTEEAHTDACLDFLHSLYRLEGTLRFHDTRELFSGFLVDFFRSHPNANSPRGVKGRQKAERPNGVPQSPVGGQKAGAGSQGIDEQRRQCTSGGAVPSSHGVGSAEFTLREVQDFINTWASRQLDSLTNRAEYCEGAFSPQTAEAPSTSDKRIGEWLRVEVFPKFISSPIIQRRIAQLAASCSVVNWGIDPLKSPLLVSNIFDGGCQQPP